MNTAWTSIQEFKNNASLPGHHSAVKENRNSVSTVCFYIFENINSTYVQYSVVQDVRYAILTKQQSETQ